LYAVLTLDDIRKLHQKALADSRTCSPRTVLYRNKSPEYFASMFAADRGVMKVYAKDPSGDQASPINGRIDGLFFMAEVEPGSTRGEPVRVSPFGGTRMTVPVDVMLAAAPRLYFADYYCMRGRFHYITLVMCKAGSTPDEFCAEHLLKLDVNDTVNNMHVWRLSYMS
jgi:hypothetical protein